jgi:hypothetical protein
MAKQEAPAKKGAVIRFDLSRILLVQLIGILLAKQYRKVTANSA